ncbi:putative transporter [Bdellovibrio bacteriovorus HD100]|uniref:Putative transporter n=2 Tax=Bdellovibrio bacteriovorus TaxID=959 RepID=Q6MQ54_BDEBA|nr:putative transporter [Bdellovibrio bacteriovorus HD100]
MCDQANFVEAGKEWQPMKTNGLRQNLSDNMLKGAIVLLPFILSFYFLYWMADFFDKVFSGILVPLGITLPFGSGIVGGLILIYVLGRTSDLFVAKFIKEWLTRTIKRIPVLGSIFVSISDLTDFFRKAEGSPHGQAVIVRFENPEFRIAGFLTRTDLNTLPTADSMDELVAVYIPLAYMVGGGFTVFVHKDKVQNLNMSFEKAMQANLSAWILKG